MDVKFFNRPSNLNTNQFFGIRLLNKNTKQGSLFLLFLIELFDEYSSELIWTTIF